MSLTIQIYGILLSFLYGFLYLLCFIFLRELRFYKKNHYVFDLLYNLVFFTSYGVLFYFIDYLLLHYSFFIFFIIGVICCYICVKKT